MASLFSGAQMGGDGGANDGGMSGGGLPLSEAEGMPSLSGMSPSDAAAFLQGNKKVSPPALSPAMLSASLHEKSCIKARLMLGSCHRHC